MAKAVKKKIRLEHHISQHGAVKAKIAQTNSQVSEGGTTVKPGRDSIHELIIWKVNPFVASVTCNCSRYQIKFKWSANFWQQFLVNDEMENISMYEISFRHSLNSRILSWQKFHNELACVLTAHFKTQAKCRLKSTTTNRWRRFGNRNSANHPYCFLSNQEKL